MLSAPLPAVRKRGSGLVLVVDDMDVVRLAFTRGLQRLGYDVIGAADPEVRGALTEVANYRRVELSPLREVLDGYPALAQSKRIAWRRKQLLEERLPRQFDEVLETVMTFVDPLLSPAAANISLTWRANSQRWN